MTAVEFLFKELLILDKKMSIEEILTQAKEMERKQQGYSEKEVLEIVEQAIKDYNSKQLHLFDGSFSNPIYTNLKKWFEQFKNK